MYLGVSNTSFDLVNSIAGAGCQTSKATELNFTKEVAFMISELQL